MRTLACLLILLACFNVVAQRSFSWPDRRTSAIVLTYDDAVPSQLNVAIPQLDSVNLKGTFFLMGRFTEEESVKWRNAGKSGHELANHSLFHPCPASYYKADPRYTAERYTVANMMREIAVMNTFLFLLDSRTERTYAFPCVQAATGDGSYADSLKRSKLFRYARGGGDQNAIITDFQHLDLFNVPSYGFSNNPDGAQLIDFVKRVQQKGGLGVIMFHGVGGDYLNVSAQAHRELTRYLKAHEKEIWTGTFLDVLGYVEKNTKTDGVR